MAFTKITLTLETEKGISGNSEMAQTLGLLAGLVDTPTSKVVLTLQCEEDDAESYKDDLRAALERRPVGIKVNIKTLMDEDVENERMATVTPMDKVWNN
jgi:hypothetical protein